MLNPKTTLNTLKKQNLNFYSGVPDSLMKPLCNTIQDHCPNHIIAANEGAAIALAIGHHLATGEIPVVYLQNSGLGNIINPLLSMAHPNVYAIPMLIILGWRGEPGTQDEPQHNTQGITTRPILDAMNTDHTILSKEEPEATLQIQTAIEAIQKTNTQHVLLVQKDTFSPYELQNSTPKISSLSKTQALKALLTHSPKNTKIISTTGKISRELYDLRKESNQNHNQDFLCIGAMGHASQIALAYARAKKDTPVICIDGDGSTLMHMGAIAIIGTQAPENFTHILLNNGTHDSVGGQPTIATKINIPEIAKACGYKTTQTIHNEDDLEKILSVTNKIPKPALIEIKLAPHSNKKLGRPTESPVELKQAFTKKGGQ